MRVDGMPIQNGRIDNYATTIKSSLISDKHIGDDEEYSRQPER